MPDAPIRASIAPNANVFLLTVGSVQLTLTRDQYKDIASEVARRLNVMDDLTPQVADWLYQRDWADAE